MKKFLPVALLCLLAACSDQTKQNLKETIGMGRNSPDEFLIPTNEPLQMPKDFSTLPVPGEVRVGATNRASPQTMAKEAFVSDGRTMTARDEIVVQSKQQAQPETLDAAEKAFMSNIGSGRDDIKEVIAKDNDKNKPKSLFGTRTSDVVDSEKEAERIKEIQEKGGKVTGEDTPTTRRSTRE